MIRKFSPRLPGAALCLLLMVGCGDGNSSVYEDDGYVIPPGVSVQRARAPAATAGAAMPVAAQAAPNGDTVSGTPPAIPGSPAPAAPPDSALPPGAVE